MGEFGTDKWFRRNQLFLLAALNAPIPKIRQYFRENIIVPDIDDKILISKITPNSVHYAVDRDIRAANFYSLDAHANHIRNNFFRLFEPLHRFDLKFANPFIPALNLGYDNLTANSSTKDGYVTNSNADWDTCRNSGTGNAYSTTLSCDQAISAYYSSSKINIIRSFFYFNTSSMGLNKTISLAQFSLFGITYSESDVCVLKGTQSTTLSGLNFGAFTGSSFGNTTSWITTNYNDITLNSTGQTWVNNNTNCRMCAREYDHDYLNSNSGTSNYRNGCYYSDKGVGYYPKIYIEYSTITEIGKAPFPFLRW